MDFLPSRGINGANAAHNLFFQVFYCTLKTAYPMFLARNFIMASGSTPLRRA